MIGTSSAPAPRISHSDVTRPAALGAAAREQLLASIRGVFANVFDCDDPDAYLRKGLAGSLGTPVLCRYWDGSAVVGFTCAVIDECDVDGVPYSVIRGLSALHPEYRGRRLTLAFWVRLVVPYLLRNPRRTILVFAPIAHMSSYTLLRRLAPVMYPDDRGEAPRAIRHLAARLANHCGYRTEGGNPWVAALPARVRRIAPPRSPAADVVRSWNALNPQADAGRAVVVLVPLTHANVMGGLVRFARTTAVRFARDSARALRRATGTVAGRQNRAAGTA